MPGLRVEIVRYAHDWQPGWVECRFTDLTGRVYTFEEKVPMLTEDYLDAGSTYPRPGIVGCTVLGITGNVARVAVDPINDYFECEVDASALVDLGGGS